MSPDSKWIAFVARVPGSPLGWERSVYLMPAGGGEAKQLTQTKYDDKMPTWLVE